MERKTGRPRAKKQGRAGDYIGLRAPHELKQRIEAAAKAANRSISSETQFRLEQSFRDQNYFAELQEMLGGRATFGIAMILARVMHEAGTMAVAHNGLSEQRLEHWPRDPLGFDQAARAVMAVLDALRPAGEIPAPRVWKGPPEVADRLNARLASLPESIAAARLQDVARPADAVTAETQEWGRQVRDLLAEKKS